MKSNHQLRRFLAALGSATLAVSSTSAADRYWDGGTVDIGTDGNVATAGGNGTWNTSILNWGAGAVPEPRARPCLAVLVSCCCCVAGAGVLSRTGDPPASVWRLDTDTVWSCSL